MTPRRRTGERQRAAEHYHDPDVPAVGCFRIVLRRGAAASGIRIWLGYGVDPDTGEEMTERGMAWQCELNGARVDLHNHWPGCAREPISREEYDRLVVRNRTMDETSPFYDTRRPVDLRSAPMPF